MLPEGFDGKNRNPGRGGAEFAPDEVEQRGVGAGGARRRADVEERVALEALRKGHVDVAAYLLFEKAPSGSPATMPTISIDLASSALYGEVVADAPHVTPAAAGGLGRVAFGPLDALAEGVTVGPELPGQHIVNDGDGGRVRRLGFDLGEGAAAQERQTHRREIVGADAVPADVKGQALGRGGGVGVGRRFDAGALDGTVDGR